MRLIFLREETHQPDDVEYRELIFVDPDTSKIHLFWQGLGKGQQQHTVWWYTKIRNMEPEGKLFVEANDTGNLVMDSLKDATMPFRE